MPINQLYVSLRYEFIRNHLSSCLTGECNKEIRAELNSPTSYIESIVSWVMIICPGER